MEGAGKRIFWGRRGCLLVVFFLLFMVLSAETARAKVDWMEITERSIFAGGMPFGDVGPYEKIRGRLHYAVDVNNPANARIVDLKLAPRNAAGEVEFSGDFILLKPVDLSKGNHRLLYEVNNRGRILMLGYYNDAPEHNDPSTVQHAGNGWLMNQGYSLFWSAWNWDVQAADQKLQIELPIVTENGQTITQLIAAEIDVLNAPAKVQPFAWGGSLCYEAVNPEDNRMATLSVRDEPMGKRTEIPRDRWRFGKVRDGKVVADSTHVYYEDGFQRGRIYELLYVAKNPRVVGLGLAAVRDSISFFHFETKDRRGTPNPLAVSPAGNAKPDPEFSYIFGISQSGRVIIHMIYEGFHVDEEGRMVFEAANPAVAGGGKGGFNFRFAQTTQHPSHIEGNYFPADFFPFNFTEQYDPVAGQSGDVLALAKKMGKIPHILMTNHELEYWTRSASLIHTDVSGLKDAYPSKMRKLRIYMVNGAPHIPFGARTEKNWEHSQSTINPRPVGRALLVSLDRWLTVGIDPPDDAYPRIDRGELMTAWEHRLRFPRIPGYHRDGIRFPARRHPGKNLQPPRVDYGPRFFAEGIQDFAPPRYFGPCYTTLVPSVDSDGNGVGGIRLPDLAVPLGTYQGWNPRKTEIGAPDYLARFAGSFWIFALTEKERQEKGDPRPSLEARYPTKQAYVDRVIAEARKVREKGFLLEEDEQAYVGRAKRMVWPPVAVETYPFWKME